MPKQIIRVKIESQKNRIIGGQGNISHLQRQCCLHLGQVDHEGDGGVGGDVRGLHLECSVLQNLVNCVAS